MDEFVLAYVEAAFFTSTYEDEDGETILADQNYGILDLDESQILDIQNECQEFLKENELLITRDNCLTDENPMAQAGHDFWMSRNRLGVGFWEKDDWESKAGDKLQESAESFGSCHFFFDDGKIYIE